MIYFKTKEGEKLSAKQAFPKVKNRIDNIFLDFGLMILFWIGNVPFHCFRRFFYRLAGMKIGRGSTIHMWARFYQPDNIVIGEDTIIGDHCFLDGRQKLTIGNHVAMASEVSIYNSEHDIQSEDFRPIEENVSIEDYCFIGPRVIILPGVIVGKGAIIGAGAVVTKNVASMTIVGGVPAKEIGQRNIKNLHYRLGRARLFQ